MRLTQWLTRYVSLRLGYMYEVADSPRAGGAFGNNHDLDLGLDYTRALSESGRTTVSFRSGARVTPQDQGTAVSLTGNAEVVRRIGRTWSAASRSSRGVQPLEALRSRCSRTR